MNVVHHGLQRDLIHATPFVPSTTTKEETKEKSRINRKENEIGNNNNNKLQSISDQRKPEVEET